MKLKRLGTLLLTAIIAATTLAGWVICIQRRKYC